MLKSFIGSGSWKYKCVLALGFLAASGGALAFPCDSYTASPAASGCTVDFNGGTGWTIGDSSDVVIPAGAWEKLLGASPTGAVIPNVTVLTLTENLTLNSGTLASWTETITGGNWVWFDDPADHVVHPPCTDPGPPSPCTDPFNVHDPIYTGSLLAGGFQGGAFLGSGFGTETLLFNGFSLDPTAEDPAFPGSGPQGPIEIVITKHLICLGSEPTCPLGFSVIENAVPEPGTLLLLAAGLAGLAGLRRRRYA